MQLNAFQRLHQARIENATKPFSARGGKTQRCGICQVAKAFCICHVKPQAGDSLSALLLLSENEVLKPSNTGRLIADVLSDTHVYQWSRTEPSFELIELLNNPDYFPVILFPEQYVDDTSRLASSPLRIEPGKKVLLILLDGSWREARRMFRRSPYLERFPVFSIQPEKLSEYVMRKSLNPNHLSTAEVASVAFEQLGYENESETLFHWFKAFQEAYLLSKSRGKGDSQRSALRKMREFLSRNDT